MTKINATASSLLIALLALTANASAAPALGKQVEKLNRGVVAINTASGPFISWRLLATDHPSTQFNVYRGGVRLNAAPLQTLNFTDNGGSADSVYDVRPVVAGVERATARGDATWTAPYKTIPVKQPAGGTTPDGVAYTYEINDGTAADLDGDGSYEMVIKWQPTNAKDNSQSGYTGNTYIDAYQLDGTLMWRIDLGKNIRAGAHYTHMVAYDMDGNGKAEVMLKTADGTIDGKGNVIGNPSADFRNAGGYILTGPEFLTVFNGKTGEAITTTNYLPARGTVSSWGDNYGNRVDRFLAGVANLDGQRPSAIFARGYYTRAVIAAWDFRDGQLTSRWVFDTNVEGAEARGQGAHSFSVADVDADGKDDIVYGAATISSAGKLMYTTGLCHGDALHVGKFDPTRAGLQAYMVHESRTCYGASGSGMHDAATGALLWGVSGENADIGRGVCADVDPNHLGTECWASRGNLRNVKGEQISTTRPGAMNFAVWWDGDLLRETLDGTSIGKWDPATNRLNTILSSAAAGAASNNGTKSTPVLAADLFGDWREEVVWRAQDNQSLRVYSTTDPTTARLRTLMQDPHYRVQVAGQNMGYNQPSNPGFYLGHGMGDVSYAPVYVK